jgi:3-oxoacyl-[acyl-carrier protein] reductase
VDVKLKGRVAMVTGGGRGLGRGIALELARAGARVAVVSRTLAQLEEVVAEIMAHGGEAIAVVADVSDRD